MNQRDPKLQNKNSQLLEEARRRQKERALLSDSKPLQKNWDGWEEQESLYQKKPSKVSIQPDRQDFYQPSNQIDRSDRLSKAENLEYPTPSNYYNNADRMGTAERFTQDKSENYLQKSDHTSSSLLSSQPAEDFKQFIDREYLQLKTELENLRKCSKPVQSSAFTAEKQSKANSSHSVLPERVEKRAGIKQESIAPAFIGKFSKAEKPTGSKKQPFIEVVFKEKPTRDKDNSVSPQAQHLRSVQEPDRPNSALGKKSQPLKVESCSIDIVPEGRKSPVPQTKRSADDRKTHEYEKVAPTGLQKGSSGRAASVNTAEKYQDSRPQRAAWPDCPQQPYGWENRFPAYQGYGYPYYQFPQVHSVPHMPQMQQIPPMQPMQPMQPMHPMQPMGHMQAFPSGPYGGVNFMQPYYNPPAYGGYMPNPYNAPQFPGGYANGPQVYMSTPPSNEFYSDNNFPARKPNTAGPAEANEHHNENYEYSHSEHSHRSSPLDESNFSGHEETGKVLREDKIETFDFEESEPSSNFVASKRKSEDLKASSSRKSLDSKSHQPKSSLRQAEDLASGHLQPSNQPSDPAEAPGPSSKKAVLMEFGVNNKKSLAEIFKEKNKT